MPFFVVKHDLPGVTPEALRSAGIRAKSCFAEMTGEGQPVRWVRSFFLPETGQTHPVYADCGSAGNDAGNGVKQALQRGG
jgi:hypothetical protein